MASRRGGIMPAIAVALFVCGACMALVLNEYWLSNALEETRSAAEAAALAGAQQLVTDNNLKPDFEPVQNADHVRFVIETLIRETPVFGPHAAKVDIRLGKTEYDPATGHTESIESDEDPTSVLVTVHRDNRSGNPVGMIAPAFTGQPGADVAVTANASVCNVINGLQPVSVGTIPAWPIAILEKSPDDSVPSWALMIEGREGADRYSWDAANNQILEAPDGLPELTLSLPGKDGVGNMVLVDIGAGLGDDVLLRQFQQGWSRDDLADRDGQFSMVDAPFPMSAAVASNNEIESELEKQIGKPRIALLYSMAVPPGKGKSQSSALNVEVTRMVGLRLMSVDHTPGGTKLVVQPAVISTRTAIVDEDALYRGETQGNRYIYKLGLTNR
ncbi:hypothetical protein [Planctomicrobium sp. SH527]|uniref:hypothetical protein n=1 Tax=Planctomicrobium sp. SH527 TaxID=3448123 RepID=UPI003F5AF196